MRFSQSTDDFEVVKGAMEENLGDERGHYTDEVNICSFTEQIIS